MKKLPKTLIRPDDKERFTLNKDGETYSLEFMKKEFPKSLRCKYSFEVLKSHGFYEEVL